MGKPHNSPVTRYLPEAMAVVLVVAIALFFSIQLTNGNLRAQTATMGYTIKAELTDEQPTQLGQLPDQWIARYRISTDSPAAVLVNSLDLYALGTLKSKFAQRSNLAPLYTIWDETVIGQGVGWVMSYGSIQQLVELTPPISISQGASATVDIYADLTGLNGYSFGVELENIVGSIPARDLPVAGRAYKIQTFL